MQPDNSRFIKVTSDEWADFVSDFRTYHTEGIWRMGYSIMYSRLSGGEKHGAVIAEVHYLPNGEKEYFILKGLKL